MLHAGASQTTAACAAGTAWSRDQRNATRWGQAASCLALGQGSWRPLRGVQTEPYLLDPELRLGREKRHWWGVCDADLSRGNESAGQHAVERPPRPALLHEWAPEGSGCAALHKDQPALPELGALACAFCAMHAGRSVLFVGDSVQGELFLAFASILGVVGRARVNPGNEGCRKVALVRYEVRVRVRVKVRVRVLARVSFY